MHHHHLLPVDLGTMALLLPLLMVLSGDLLLEEGECLEAEEEASEWGVDVTLVGLQEVGASRIVDLLHPHLRQ